MRRGASLRSPVFPDWLGWAGLVVGAAALVFGIAFAGSRLELAAHPFFVLWILATSVLLLRRPVPPEPA